MDKLESRVKEIILEIMPGADYDKTSNLQQDLEFDSLDVIALLFEVEKVFDIKIPEEDIEKDQLLIIGPLCAYIRNKAPDYRK